MKLVQSCAVASAFVGLTLAGSAAAQDEVERPEVFENVLKCREIVDNEARLACFDQSVAAMQEAEASDELLLADREEVRKTRKGLFGLSLPKIGLFSSDDDELDEIVATVAKVGRNRKGWVFTLEDGAVWQQIDGRYLHYPEAGDTITISKGAIGSFKGRINKGASFRITRIK